MKSRFCRRRCGRSAVVVLLGTLLFLPPAAQPDPVAGGDGESPCHEGPLLLVPLRIHGGGSGRSLRELRVVREEINRIWRSQAGICFSGEIVAHDKPLATGMDIWFLPTMERYNGYFFGPNAIRVRDFPDLRPAASPSSDGAARTAAHEIGHGLGLAHRQDSEENLMRSKSFGWRLAAGEVATARRAAASLHAGGPDRPDCPCPGEIDPRREISVLPER